MKRYAACMKLSKFIFKNTKASHHRGRKWGNVPLVWPSPVRQRASGFTASQLENSCMRQLCFYGRSERLSGDVLTACWLHALLNMSHWAEPTLPSAHCWRLVKCSSDLHVFRDRCVADGVGCSRDGGLAAVTAATAVQAGHVDPVEIIMVLPPSVAQGLILAVFIAPAHETKPMWNNRHQRDPLYYTSRDKGAAKRHVVTFCFSSVTAWGRETNSLQSEAKRMHGPLTLMQIKCSVKIARCNWLCWS